MAAPSAAAATAVAPPAPPHFAFASACTLPTAAGDFEMRVYRDARSGVDAVAMVARVAHGARAAAVAAAASSADFGGGAGEAVSACCDALQRGVLGSPRRLRGLSARKVAH